MRTIVVICCSILCLSAQTPAKTPPKAPLKAPPKTTAAPVAHHKPPMLNPALYKAKAPETYKAKFMTTKGDFIVEVHRAWAPLGADRFYNLVKGGFYDGGAFFRVLENFMAQFGFSPNPAVTKVWEKATIKDDPVLQSNKRGFITYATAGPNTRTTQVFINFADNSSSLDAKGFAPFGTVVEGMDVVDKLYNGYGEGAPDGRGPEQGKIGEQGAVYLKKNFPLLDTVTSAEIVP